jgi:hypothetical protein
MARQEMKYIILEEEDADKYLSPEQKVKLEEIRATIYMGRRGDKKPHNQYVVVNMREPYAEPFWDIIVAFEQVREDKAKEVECPKS